MKIRLESAVIAAGKFAKQRIAPSIVSIAKAFTASGAMAISMPALVTYLSSQKKQDKDSDASHVTTALSIIVTLYITFTLSIPAIFHYFSGKKLQTKEESPDTPLGLLGKVINFILNVLGSISVFCIGLIASRKAIALLELIGDIKHNDPMTSNKTKLGITLGSIPFGIANIYYQLARPQKSYRYYAKQISYRIEHGQFKLNPKAAISAFSICFIGTAGTIFDAYFFSDKVMSDIPYVSNLLHHKLKSALIWLSTITAIVKDVMTNFPTMYLAFDQGHEHHKYRNPPCYDKPLAASIYAVGTPYAIINGASGSISCIKSLNRAFNIDEKNIFLRIGACVVGFSMAAKSYAFDIHETYHRVRDQNYQALGLERYEPDNNDTVETGSVSDDSTEEIIINPTLPGEKTTINTPGITTYNTIRQSTPTVTIANDPNRLFSRSPLSIQESPLNASTNSVKKASSMEYISPLQ